MGQFTSLILPILLLVLMWFFLIRPQQKVTTIGGIKGTVKSVDETTVVITVNGHGTEMTFEKPAIKQVDPS